jgi:hypothetical protein
MLGVVSEDIRGRNAALPGPYSGATDGGFFLPSHEEAICKMLR